MSFIELDPGIFEAQSVRLGNAARSDEYLIDGDRIMIAHPHFEAAIIIALNALELRVEAKFNALHHRDLKQPVTDRLIILAQYHV